jgi:hypothetical protein
MKSLILAVVFVAGCTTHNSVSYDVASNYHKVADLVKGKQLYDLIKFLGPPNRAITYNVANYNTIQFYEWRTPYVVNRVHCKVSFVVSVWSKTGKIIYTSVSRMCGR